MAEAFSPSTGERTRRPAKNLILGVVDYYDYFEIRPFLKSLAQSGFVGHICLFAGPSIKPRTERRLKADGIEVVRYRREFPFVADADARLPAAPAGPLHLYNLRHFLYLDYLLKNGGRFANVLITDVRDVIFQADPFAFPMGHSIHVAMENPAIPVGSCEWTSGWILAGYPPEALDKVKNQPLSCAGTTLAPVTAMIRYLELMLGEIGRMRDAGECADQAAHNLLLHQGMLDPVEKLRNFEGPILTVGSEPRYLLDDRARLVNRDGSVIALVHQYDRHPELRRLIERRTIPSGAARFVLKTVSRIKNKLRRMRAGRGR